MFSFEKVSFFDTVVALQTPSQSNASQSIRPQSQESGDSLTKMPLWRKIKKQERISDIQNNQMDGKMQTKPKLSVQKQRKIELIEQLREQSFTGNEEKYCKSEGQSIKNVEFQDQMDEIQVLQRIDFEDINQIDKFMKLQEIKNIVQTQENIQQQQLHDIKIDNLDNQKVQDQNITLKYMQRNKLKNSQNQFILKNKSESLIYQNPNQPFQGQKINLPIESQEQPQSQIQITHQQKLDKEINNQFINEQIQQQKQINTNNQHHQSLSNHSITPDLGVFQYKTPQKQQNHNNFQNTQIKSKHQIQKQIENPKTNSLRNSQGIRNSLSLYERIIEHNSNKPNMRLFVEMQNNFQPIRKTQTEKFNSTQLKKQLEKMTESLPVEEVKSKSNNLQIVNSVSALIEPDLRENKEKIKNISIKKEQLQKQFTQKIKQLQDHYLTKIHQQNDSFKQLFNQMKTEIQHLQSEKSKLSDQLYDLHKEISTFKTIEIPKKQQIQSLQSENQKLKNQLYQLKQNLFKYQNESLTFHLKYEPLLQQIINSKLQQPPSKPTSSQIYQEMTFLYEKLQIKELQCQKLQLQKNQLFVELRRQKQKIKQLQIAAQNQWNENNLKYQALEKQFKILKYSYNQLLNKNQNYIEPFEIYPQNSKKQQKIQSQIKQNLAKRYLYINNPDNLYKKITNQGKKSYLNPQQQFGLTKALKKKNEQAMFLSPKVQRMKNKFSNQIQHYRTPQLERLQKHLNSLSRQKSRNILKQIQADIKLPSKQNKVNKNDFLTPYKNSQKQRHYSPISKGNLNLFHNKNLAVQNINAKLQKLRAQVRKELQAQ